MLTSKRDMHVSVLDSKLVKCLRRVSKCDLMSRYMLPSALSSKNKINNRIFFLTLYWSEGRNLYSCYL